MDENVRDTVLVHDFNKIQHELSTLFAAKQACYGPANIARFGIDGVLIRMYDKMQRLLNLVWDKKENAYPEETVRDTFMDMAVYGTIALLIMNGEWPGCTTETEEVWEVL